MIATAESRKTDSVHTAESIRESELRAVSARVSKRPAARPSSAMPAFNEAGAILPIRSRVATGPVFKASIGKLIRHPDNRQPTAEQVQRMLETIQAEGQLEPIVVRHLPDGHPHRARAIDGSTPRPGEPCWQIISGETRTLAQFELGQPTLDARQLTDCDDARALELLAVFNAAREDLNPIQKARMIARLCESIDAGGAGMTREAAGKVYGLESGSAASNLVRLLELPEPVQQLVESGALPQTFAREALPFCAVPAIAAAIPKVVAKWKGNATDRRGWLQDLSKLAVRHTRPMHRENLSAVSEWSLQYNRQHLGRLFEVTKEQTEQLQVVKLRVYHGEQSRAMNVKLWEQLQAVAIEEWRANRAHKQKQAADRSSSSKGSAKPLTPAEEKKRKADKARQLSDRIRAWRHAWLRELVASVLDDHPEIVERMRCWLAVGPTLGSFADSFDLSRETVGQLAGGNRAATDRDVWEAVSSIDCERCYEVSRELIKALLLAEDKNPKWPRLRHDLVDSLAAMAAVDLEASWRGLQLVRGTNGEPNVRFETFFLLHDKAQLEQLAEELDVNVYGAGSKSDLVRRFARSSKTLRLPKSIAVVATGEKRKRRAK